MESFLLSPIGIFLVMAAIAILAIAFEARRQARRTRNLEQWAMTRGFTFER